MKSAVGKGLTPTVALLVYVAVIHVMDTLATHGAVHVVNWSWFQWQAASGFDLFKCLAWFVVPFAFTVWRIDPGYFGFGRWKRIDWLVLLGFAVLGAVAVALVPFIPSLRAIYPTGTTWAETQRLVIWTCSWLVGWEFLHRYVLLTHFQRRWPRMGWLIVPIVEGLYHLQKPPLEAAGMVVASVVLCRWTIKRQNVLLPFLAHGIIELELIALMFLRGL